MFTLINGLPPYAVGIVASGHVTADDFKTVLVPALEKTTEEWKGINLMLVMQTELKNFSLGAWLQDIKTNLAYFAKWNKLAVVANDNVLETITKAFSVIAPGEAKTFSDVQLEEAREWISSP